MTGTTVVMFLLGLWFLIAGGELLVRGASRLAGFMGISPLVIGLTVVAFGTSSPEMAVSVQSSLAGQADIALGNIVGSNICNILLILGLSAAVTPLIVSQQLVRLDVPIMIGISILMLIFALDGKIGRFEGGLLFAGVLSYTAFLIVKSRRENKAIQDEYAREYEMQQGGSVVQWLVNGVFILGGFALLVLGSRWLVNTAVVIAKTLGVSELVIGLTIVSLGTSLPEVATSVMASIRGERDIAVGNVVGSNIFNILCVLGLSSAVAPNGISVSEAVLTFDIPVMLAVSIACLPIFFTGNMISRWEGLLFLGYYVAYTTYLVLYSTQHKILPVFNSVMLIFVVPITVLTLSVLVVRALRADGGSRSTPMSG